MSFVAVSIFTQKKFKKSQSTKYNICVLDKQYRKLENIIVKF